MDFRTQSIIYTQEVESRMAQLYVTSGAVEPLKSSMGYSLFAGGKRLRPTLLLAACDLFCETHAHAIDFACAVEMIHTYSLIHDDLPAMDNDIMRRGRPTNHMLYGEGIALLAGVGLYSIAIEAMLSCVNATKAQPQIAAMQLILQSSGCGGILSGQTLDLAQNTSGTQEGLDRLNELKTGVMFINALLAGATLGNAPEQALESIRVYGKSIGLCFQIVDDILDVEGDAEQLGKSIGKDEKLGKTTYVSLLGAEQAKQTVKTLTQQAVDALQPFGNRGAFLSEMALQLSQRIF